MPDSRPAPLSFRPTRRLRDEEFDENLFDEAARRRREEQRSLSADTTDGDVCVDDEDTAVEDDQDLEPPRQREGLPASFRMRHDSHYVDQVVSRRVGEPVHLIAVGEIDGPHPVVSAQELQPLVRSVARFGILQPLLVRRHAGRYELIAGSRRLAAAMAAGLSEVPCFIYFAEEERARALAEAERIHHSPAPQASEAGEPAIPAAAIADLTEHLGAIGACLHLFGDRERPLRERIAMGLIQAEVQRAAWLSQALVLLAGEPSIASNPVDLGSAVERIVAALTPERVLAGMEFEVTAATQPALVRGDEQLCSLAVAGLVAALQPIVERTDGARIRLSLHVDATARTVSLDASQDVLNLPAIWQARFLDRGWHDRPGGHRAGVMLAAASRVAALHGGSLTFVGNEGHGCRLVLTFPTI